MIAPLIQYWYNFGVFRKFWHFSVNVIIVKCNNFILLYQIFIIFNEFILHSQIRQQIFCPIFVINDDQGTNDWNRGPILFLVERFRQILVQDWPIFQIDHQMMARLNSKENCYTLLHYFEINLNLPGFGAALVKPINNNPKIMKIAKKFFIFLNK